MARQLTVRGVPEDIGRRLERLSRERGQSVNTTLVQIIESAVGVDARREQLKKYTTWSESDAESFEKALADQRGIDDELWR
jgi:hypothetical protein